MGKYGEGQESKMSTWVDRTASLLGHHELVHVTMDSGMDGLMGY